MSKGIAATRVLFVRGVAMRAVSGITGIALIALVAPTDLGLLAVVRGFFSLLDFATELGFQGTFLRRKAAPTAKELGAFAGARTVLLVALFVVALFVPGAATVFGLVPDHLAPWLLLAFATQLLLPIHSLCMVLLERDLAFGKLAVVEVNGLLLQNLALVGFAAIGQFQIGIFLAQMGFTIYVAVALLRARPVWEFSLDLRPLGRVWRDGAGFAFAGALRAAREYLTPVVIAAAFSLEVAGLWALAARAVQFLQMAIEGYYRAGFAVAGQLSDSPGALAKYAAASAREAAGIAFGITGTLWAIMPLVGVLLPRWAPAVPIAQTAVLAIGVLGTVHAILLPLAIARLGAEAIIWDRALDLVFLLLALMVLRVTQIDNVGLAFAAGAAAPLVYVVLKTKSMVGREVVWALGRPSAVLAASVGLQWSAAALGASATAAAMIAAAPSAVALTHALLHRFLKWGARVEPPDGATGS